MKGHEMRRRIIQRVIIAVSGVLVCSGVMVAATDSSRTPFLKAVDGGMVNLTIEAAAEGDKLVLTFSNVGRGPVSIQVQQGETKIPVPTSQVLVISSPQARNLDLPAGKSTTITVSQAVGQNWLVSGKIIFEKTQDGMRASFEKATWGASKHPK